MSEPARGLGHLPSPPDFRDVPLSALMGASPSPPSSDLLRPHVVALLDQSSTEGCCGWSFVNGLWARWNHLAASEGRPPLAQPSPLFAWWMARHVDGNQLLNIGTYVRNVYRQARAFGIAPERDWSSIGAERLAPPTAFAPPSLPGFATQPDQLALTSAYDQRFPLAYYRVDLEPDRRGAFQRALASGRPVQFGTPVTRAFLRLLGHEPVSPPRPGDEMAGGHSMTAISYDERGVYGPNNWGALWGNAGWFALSWEYIEWVGTSDCWAIDCGLPATWPALEVSK